MIIRRNYQVNGVLFLELPNTLSPNREYNRKIVKDEVRGK